MEKTKTLASGLLHKKDNQAAWIPAQGERIRVDAAEYPTPGPNEIVIKVHTAAVNPVDWKIQDTGMFVQKWPTIIGSDAAGEVYAVGDGVTRFKVGDRVTSQMQGLGSGDIRQTGYQHYAVANPATTAKIPEGISFTNAAVLPLGLSTAAVGLYKPRSENFLGLAPPSLTPKPSGETILVWGGSSSVGAMAIQLAVASGAAVVTVASQRNHDFVKKLGASAAVDYNSGNVVEAVVQAIKEVGGTFVGVYDAISEPASYKYTLPILEQLGGGPAALVLPAPAEKPANVQFGQVFSLDPATHPVWEHYVTPALESGKLLAVPEPLVVGKGLEYVQKGLDESKKGVSAQKLVVEL